MYAISSSITSQTHKLTDAKAILSGEGFSLGGNWDYDRGYFDCALDEALKVWLRLPITATSGRLDDQTEDTDTIIRFGEPFVLKHIYKEDSDPEAQMKTMGALLDQFSDPLDPDAQIESKWIDQAKQKIKSVESRYSS
jgi:hypothetical protein